MSVIDAGGAGSAGAAGNQLATQIIRLQYENANNLVAVLRPLITANNTINANPGMPHYGDCPTSRTWRTIACPHPCREGRRV